jgi:hypothetical protein
MAKQGNEVGIAPRRGLPQLSREDAEHELSAAADTAVHVPENAVVSSGPATCPACSSQRVTWGYDADQTRSREEIHPLVWHDTQRMADSFICRDCNAGWIEPDEPETITWVRPYWRV